MLDQVEKKKEDHAVNKLLAGYVPLLVCGDTDSEGHHEHGPTDQRDAGEDTQDERKTEDGLEVWDGVAEAEGEAMRERRLREVFGGRSGEGTHAVVDADESMTGEVDSEGDAKKCVGEDLVIDSHPL